MAGPVLDLVIVHLRRPDDAARTAGLFLDQGVPARVLVVDNGSSEADVARLRAFLPPGVEVLELGANRGFGPGANAGFRWFLARGAAPWLGVAPHDAEPRPGCLSRLLDEVGTRPRAGLASADVGDGVTPTLDRYFGAIPAAATVANGWEPAGYPHGTLMVARRHCLQHVGLFDERYFAYCEEAELALRAREAGWEVGVVRGAEVRNRDIGSPTAVVDYLQLRNTLLMVREHSGHYHAAIRLLMALGQVAAGLVAPSRRGPYWSPRARLRAIADHLCRRYGPPPSRLTPDDNT
ncbi:MAG TPA: glycosyltransferase [Acidimicrobiales bacterium]|nr:glycosyltransferase [Acidimicrobiales bacterium]